MKIRPLALADAPAYWALRLRGLREDPGAFGSSYEESSRLPPEEAAAADLGREGHSEDDFVLGAFEGDALVGVVRLEREARRKRAHRASLRGMYVAREARGRGVARALCQALLERAKGLPGLARLNLTVMSDNAAGVALYRSLGFEIWGTEPDAMRLEGTSRAEYSMGLRLPG